MKRFIIISLLALATLPMLACAWQESHNYYLFSVCGGDDFRDRVDKTCDNNWKEYLGITENRWRYYDADDIIAAAQRKGDVLMVSYVKNLEKYLECARSAQNTWEYPTKEEIAERNKTLQEVRTYAQGKVTSRLRSQHGLLLMRCNMMLGRHQENVTFWEQTANQFINSVYRDMMQNIYAGALLRTGNADKAGELFAEMGDWSSLMTQYYEKRSCAAIRQQYLANPNASVLPFLLQDFVNNTQEAVDVDFEAGSAGYLQGKLFVRDIQRSEGEQMIKLCGQVISEGKTLTPALWQSAKAWIEYLYGNRQQGISDILAATKMDGTERQKDNVRVLMLYMTAMQAKPGQAFDDYLADELEWLDNKKQQDSHYERVKDRLLHQALTSKYSNRPELAVALLKASYDYDQVSYMDTMKVENLLKYLQYRKSPAQTALDRYLKANQDEDKTDMNDLVGTKYMRLRQWDKAEQWLQKVPLSFYNGKGYAVYAANRNYHVEPWLKRQFLKESVEYADMEWKVESNPKLDFVREIQRMEGELNVLSGKALQQRCYDLAACYAQAHFTGDCWYLMRDGKSVMDTLRVNEADLAARCRELLQKASLTNDFQLKEKSLFALTYGYLYTAQWQKRVWSDEKLDFVPEVDPTSPHYKAMANMTQFVKKNATRISPYVSRCDNYLQFAKVYK